MKVNLNDQLTVHLTAKGLARVLEYHGEQARHYLGISTLSDVRYTNSIWQIFAAVFPSRVEIEECLTTMDAELKEE